MSDESEENNEDLEVEVVKPKGFQRAELFPTVELDLTDEQKSLVEKATSPQGVRQSYLQTIPMVCKGPDCGFAWVCPLQKANIAPVGKPCPIETKYVETFFFAYCDELQVDITSMIEVSMVRELVDQEIQTLRKSNLLALEDFIIESVVGVDSKGHVMYKKELHPAIALEERLHRRKSQLRKELLATREAQAKHLGPKEKPKEIADIIAHYEEARKKIDQGSVIDAEVVDDEE